jgi:hypothetical protein
LPDVVQRYYRQSGFIDKPELTYLRSEYHDVDFKLAQDKPEMKIEYTVINMIDIPRRMAYIEASLYGIPFEALIHSSEQEASMRGTLQSLLPV